MTTKERIIIDSGDSIITVAPNNVRIEYPSEGKILNYKINVFLETKWSKEFMIARSALYRTGWYKPYMEKVIKNQIKRNAKATELGYAPMVHICGKCQKVYDTFAQADQCHWHIVRIREWCPAHKNVVGECECVYKQRPSKNKVYDPDEHNHYPGAIKDSEDNY